MDNKTIVVNKMSVSSDCSQRSAEPNGEAGLGEAGLTV